MKYAINVNVVIQYTEYLENLSEVISLTPDIFNAVNDETLLQSILNSNSLTYPERVDLILYMIFCYIHSGNEDPCKPFYSITDKDIYNKAVTDEIQEDLIIGYWVSEQEILRALKEWELEDITLTDIRYVSTLIPTNSIVLTPEETDYLKRHMKESPEGGMIILPNTLIQKVKD